jgi:hypothetical protein
MQGSHWQKRPRMAPYLDGIGYLHRLDIRPPVLERRVHVRYLGPAAHQTLGSGRKNKPRGAPRQILGLRHTLVQLGSWKAPMPNAQCPKPKPGLPVVAIAQLHGVDIAELLPPRSPHPPVGPPERIPLIDPVVKPEGCIRVTG